MLDKENMDEHLPFIEFAYNKTYHSKISMVVLELYLTMISELLG